MNPFLHQFVGYKAFKKLIILLLKYQFKSFIYIVY